jgi:xanthine/uracil/vitamin C permease (AzgA family)
MGGTIAGFTLGGLVVSRFVDLVRNAFDKNARIPKAYWLAFAAAVGIGFAFLACSLSDATATAFGVQRGPDCLNQALVGLGYAGTAGAWHEILTALSHVSGDSGTPKGLVPKPAP